MELSIEFLADKPELVPLLAEWTYNAWSQYNPELTVEGAAENLRQRFNREKIPLTFVAMNKEDEPVGMATLKDRIVVPGYKTKTPWLGSFYILPEYRNQGVGTELLEAIYNKARKLGYKTMYLFASDAQMVPFYEKHGWEIFATDTFYDREITLMLYNL